MVARHEGFRVQPLQTSVADTKEPGKAKSPIEAQTFKASLHSETIPSKRSVTKSFHKTANYDDSNELGSKTMAP